MDYIIVLSLLYPEQEYEFCLKLEQELNDENYFIEETPP